MQTRLCYSVTLPNYFLAVPLVFDEETGKIRVAEHEIIYPMDYLLPPTYKLKKESNTFIYVKRENTTDSARSFGVIVEYGGETEQWILSACVDWTGFYSLIDGSSGERIDLRDDEIIRHSSAINHFFTFMTETYCDHCGKWIQDTVTPPTLSATETATATAAATAVSCFHSS